MRTYRSSVLFKPKSGQGQWIFEWHRKIDVSLAGGESGSSWIAALRADGEIQQLAEVGGKWGGTDLGGTVERIVTNDNVVTWRYTVGTTGTVEIYDEKGKLRSVQTPDRRLTTLTYNKSEQLVSVTASSGRALSFSYDARGNVASVTAPDGAVTKYAYNANDMLSTVTRPDNTTRQYVYEDTRFPTALTGVIDEAGVRYATYAYDDQGRAIVSELTGGADRYQFQYGPDGQTTVLTPGGGSTVYSFLKQNGVLLPTGVSAPCPLCGKTSLLSEYDANGNATREVGYDNAATTYTYDAQGRETRRVEAAGTANAKTTTTEWHLTLNLPSRVASPGKLETFAYDGNGNLTTYSEVETVDANGAAGFAAAVDGPSKRTDWTYDDSGHVLTVTERTDHAITGTWRLTYDAQGNLVTLTNPEGKSGRITQYDGAGRVLEAVDVNGTAIKFRYNARGWLTDYDFGGQHIRYEYDAVGQRTAMIGPHNLEMRYVYDAAHRLTQILDNITVPNSASETSAVNPFGTTSSAQSFVQAIGDALASGWNGVLAWIKQQLSAFISSAHAQMIVAPGAGALTLPPIPNVSLPKSGPQYPEDVIDPNAGAVMSKVRPPNMSTLEERHYDRTCVNSQDPCVALKASAQKAIAQAKVKMNNMLNDTVLYKNAYDTPNPAVTGTNTTWMGHVNDLDGRISNIWAMINLGRKMGCDMFAETAAALKLLTPGAPL